MALTLSVYTEEQSDASTAFVFDDSDWSGVTAFDNTKLTYVNIIVHYDGDDYEHVLYDSGLAIDHLGLGASFICLFGTSRTSYYTLTPNELRNGSGDALADTYFPDGFYEVTVEITYDGSDYEDSFQDAFIAEMYQMASQLPLQIDIDNFDYQENRVQFLIISLLDSCRWAAQRNRPDQFELFAEKVNNLLDARGISGIWTT
jgi:hypothetical protein